MSRSPAEIRSPPFFLYLPPLLKSSLPPSLPPSSPQGEEEAAAWETKSFPSVFSHIYVPVLILRIYFWVLTPEAQQLVRLLSLSDRYL